MTIAESTHPVFHGARVRRVPDYPPHPSAALSTAMPNASLFISAKAPHRAISGAGVDL